MANALLSPLGAANRELLAGAAGTAAMTAAQTAYYRATDTESSSTPAEVGKRIVEGVLGRELPEQRMDALNQGMHWLYGTSWGLPFGLVAGSRRRRRSLLADGVGFGLAIWAASRGQMAAMQLAPPPWRDPPSTLAMDLGFHLLYGAAAAVAFRALR